MRLQTVKIFNELIAEKGFLKLTVKGTSMEPLLKDGQPILINKALKYRLGDCYLFRYQNRIILHRFAGKSKEKMYLFIGDNSCKIEKVFECDIIGGLLERREFKIQKVIVICINALFINIFNNIPWLARRLYYQRKKIIMFLLKVKK